VIYRTSYIRHLSRLFVAHVCEARRQNPMREMRETRERAASVILISLPLLEFAPLFVGGFKQLLVKQDKSIDVQPDCRVHCRVKQTLRRASLGKGRRDA